MLPSIINPTFFRGFETFPEVPRIMVPVQVHPFSNVLVQRELTTEAMAPFTRTLRIAISEISSRFKRGHQIADLPYAWKAYHTDFKHLMLENVSEGTTLIFDRGGPLI